MKYVGYTLLLLVTLSAIVSCSRESKVTGARELTITSTNIANTLFYSGTIQPIHTIVVPTPADGVIIEIPFQYGESVTSGQLLFMISSAKFLSDYKSALMQYIKAKNDFNNGETQLREATFLHKNLLISDDDFKTRQSTYYAAQLAMVQAKDTLENLLQQLDIKNVDLYKLTIADIDKITQALHLQTGSEILEHLRIVSPASGTILSPTKSEDENKKLSKGDVVKQGDVLAVIGDMSGLSVRVKVNELTVNQLKAGQKVKITGIAFPDHTLAGEIKRVDRQGEPSSGGLPTFSVQVEVPTLTKDQQKEIHVGMSAKVEINIEDDAKIMVPLAAIKEKNGLSYVQVLEGQKKKKQEVMVKTGKTTLDSVAILAGLKVGDKIVIPD